VGITLRSGYQELVLDETILLGAAFDFRNHRLCHTLPDGSKLEVEIGYLNWFNTGIRVSISGTLVHESHPGRDILLLTRVRKASLGIVMLGLIMARLNLMAMHWLSKDAWLTYTTFVDAPLAMVLGLLVFRFAKKAD